MKPAEGNYSASNDVKGVKAIEGAPPPEGGYDDGYVNGRMDAEKQYAAELAAAERRAYKRAAQVCRDVCGIADPETNVGNNIMLGATKCEIAIRALAGEVK